MMVGELRSRTADPSSYAELVGFSCGNGTERAEREVNKIVAACCAGKRPKATLRVTRDGAAGAIVGVSAIERGLLDIRHRDFSRERFKDAAYISVIGLSKHYRGERRRGDGPRLGDRLLVDALRHIRDTWPEGMPHVLSVVDPSNDASRSLFERHGFEYVFSLTDESCASPGAEDGADDEEVDALYWRSKRLPLT
jgi:ribosomal protein S18 acetylase RimI-like enzyme